MSFPASLRERWADAQNGSERNVMVFGWSLSVAVV